MTEEKEDFQTQPQQEEEMIEEETQSCEQETEGQDSSTSKEEEYYHQLLRLQADFENYRKRMEAQKPLFIAYGKEDIIKKLLPLYDTLLKAREETSKKECDIKHIKKGLEMIFQEFDKVFKSEGVQIVCSKGKPYDPMAQEAITTMPCEEKDDNIVLQEVAKAVTIDGKVIRPAQVIVGKKKEEETQEK